MYLCKLKDVLCHMFQKAISKWDLESLLWYLIRTQQQQLNTDNDYNFFMVV